MVYKPVFPCYNSPSLKRGTVQPAFVHILQISESEAFLMMTILFVSAVLCGAYFLLSAIDNGGVETREVGSYLRYEYNASMLSRL